MIFFHFLQIEANVRLLSLESRRGWILARIGDVE